MRERDQRFPPMPTKDTHTYPIEGEAIVVKDDLGDRMKGYEAIETARRFDPRLPVYARIDGRSFSKFTRGMERPFDPRMSAAMLSTMKALVDETGARIGYTQSDEISLIWLVEGDDRSQMFFDGKIMKLTSVLASYATAAFAAAVIGTGWPFAQYMDRHPHFDARVFQLPSKEEGANCFLWRELDATRNAVQMAAQAAFSHKQLHGVDVRTMRKMLLEEIGIDMDAYPPFFTRGVFGRRVTFERPVGADEFASVPEKHRPMPGSLITRSEVRSLEMPPLLAVANRSAVIFDGAEPQVSETGGSAALVMELCKPD